MRSRIFAAPAGPTSIGSFAGPRGRRARIGAVYLTVPGSSFAFEPQPYRFIYPGGLKVRFGLEIAKLDRPRSRFQQTRICVSLPIR
jgi:hypothetical protein